MVTSLSQKPDYLKAVGLITAEWTAVEHGILWLFAMLAGCGMEVASAIFSAVESNRGRREMTWAVAQVALKKDPALLKEVETLLDRTRKAVSKRNLYAHALWGVKQDGSVVRLSHPIKENEVSLDDLKRASDQMARLQHDFAMFTSRLFELPPSPQTP